jgi:serine/threonine protein kinase
VAIKVVRPELWKSKSFRKGLRRVFPLAASIDHPNLIPLSAVEEVDRGCLVVMRYVDGADLSEILREQGRLRPQRALEVLTPIALALDAAAANGELARGGAAEAPVSALRSSGASRPDDLPALRFRLPHDRRLTYPRRG